jgi:hypothetical protein
MKQEQKDYENDKGTYRDTYSVTVKQVMMMIVTCSYLCYWKFLIWLFRIILIPTTLVFFVSWRLKGTADDFRCLRYYCDNVSI